MTQLGETLNAIDRGAVMGILGAADAVLATKQLAERQEHAIAEVREIHSPLENSTSALNPKPQCRGCYQDSPCETIRALEEAGL